MRMLGNRTRRPGDPSRRIGKRLGCLGVWFALVLAAGCLQAQSVLVTPADQDYPDLRTAFEAINAGHHRGAVTVSIIADLVESGPVVLRANGAGFARYDSVLVRPVGQRSVSGDPGPGQPLIDLVGASNVTFDGVGSGGSSLTVTNTNTSATPGTATFRLASDAHDNVLTRLTIASGARVPVGLPGGAIVVGASDGGTGTSNNRIEDNQLVALGPGSLPTQGIACLGSAVFVDRANRRGLILGNRIEDVFAADTDSAAIRLGPGCRDWEVIDNRIYQSSARHFSGSAGSVPRHVAIEVSGPERIAGYRGAGTTGVRIQGNTIGFQDVAGAGFTTFSGTRGAFAAIRINTPATGDPIRLIGNRVSNISFDVADASGTREATPFAGVLVERGLVQADDNVVGSLSHPYALVFVSSAAAPAHVFGIVHLGSGILSARRNHIGGISAGLSAPNAALGVYVLAAWAPDGESLGFVADRNIIGGTPIPSIENTSMHLLGGRLVGIHCQEASALIHDNLVRHLRTASAGGSGAEAALQGISACEGTTRSEAGISRNVVRGLVAASGTAATVQGIRATARSGRPKVVANRVSLLVATTPGGRIDGITGGDGIVASNMVVLGRELGGQDLQEPLLIHGIDMRGDIQHNSVLILGQQVSGSAQTAAARFSGMAGTIYNNNLVNLRSNGPTGNGIHSALRYNAAFAFSEFNNLHVTGAGGHVASNGSTHYPTLVDWQTSGRDLHSFSLEPAFVSENDLHLRAESPLLNRAPALMESPWDIDGTFRVGSVDVGADERDGAAPRGGLIVVPRTLSFESAAVEERASVRALVLENPGDAGIEVLGLSGVEQPNFRFGPASTCPGFPFELPPAGSCVLAIEVDGQFAGSPDWTAYVLTGDGEETGFLVKVSNGMVPGAVDRPAIDFGWTRLGRAGNQVLRLTNDGFSPIDLIGIDALAHPFAASGCSPLPFRLLPEESCELTLGFSPVVAGLAESRLDLRIATTFSPVVTRTIEVPVEGRGSDRDFIVVPAAIDFGDVPVGLVSGAGIVSLVNTSGVSLVISPDPAIAPPFRIAPDSPCGAAPPIVLPPESSCSWRLEFAPEEPGMHSISTTLAGAEPELPLLQLRGNGSTPVVMFVDGFE